MLQKLREHSSGWLAKIILGLLVFVFSFWGIESYFMAQPDGTVASIGKRTVTQQDFQNQMNQLRQQPQIDPAEFDKPEFRQQVLDTLINQQVLLGANDDLGLVVGGDAIAQEIAGIPVFQINGRFDADTYKAILAQQGMTPVGFQQRVKDDLAMRLLPDAVQSTALAPAYELDTYIALRDQKRDVRYVDIPAPAASSSEVGDAEIGAYYKEHEADFMNPETVSISYIELKAEDMKVTSEPDDASIAARYEAEKSRFSSPEQRLVSHILVAVPPNATPEQQKAALAKAEDIEKQLADGADFAKLAEKDSDDLGSKRQGGDLGWIEPGVTDQAFDEAAFGMEKGKISAPVLSSEGYHVIWLRDVQEGSVRPLEEVRKDLIVEMLGSEQEREFNDVAGKLTDVLYSNPTSLQPAVDELGLKISTSAPFTRQGGAGGITANKSVVAAAFSDQVLAQGQNSDPVNLGPNDLVVLRVAQHTPATPKPLAEVTGVIRQRVLDERAAKAARTRAEALLARVDKGEGLDKLAAAEDLKLSTLTDVARADTRLQPQLLTEIFRMPRPADGRPSSALVDIGHGDFALVVLDAVKDGDPGKVDAAEREVLTAQLQQLRGEAALRGVIDALRARAKVRINTKNLGNDTLE